MSYSTKQQTTDDYMNQVIQAGYTTSSVVVRCCAPAEPREPGARVPHVAFHLSPVAFGGKCKHPLTDRRADQSATDLTSLSLTPCGHDETP
jgi:hypothetical protein